MENEDKNKNQRPSKMINVAFPKSKYGFYIAIFIIFLESELTIILLINFDRLATLIE